MVAQPRAEPAPGLRLVPSKQAAVYIRVSTDKQESNYSLPTQEERCRAYAAEQGYRVAEVYRETYTATELWERPELARLREALARRELDAVICYDPDRFSRKQIHSAMLQDLCERAGAELKFAMFDFTRDATGQFMLNARVFAAELEREKIMERTQRGLLARAKAGKLRGSGYPMYGYRFTADRGAYELDPATAPIVRRIFDRAARGWSTRTIAATLTAEGVPTPRGKARWSHTAVTAILRNGQYTGDARAYRVEDRRVSGKRVLRRRPAEEQIALPAGTIPPLIDPAIFEAVQGRLGRNKAESARNHREPERFLLRGGLVRCGYCGRALSSRLTKPAGRAAWACYRASAGNGHEGCGHAFTIGAIALDTGVWAKVERILTDPEIIAAELARLRESDPTGEELATVDRARADVERRRRNLLAQLEDLDPVSARDTRERLAALGAQAAALDAERAGVLGRGAGWEAARQRLADVQAWCGTVAMRLGELTYEQKRLALDALGVRVRLWQRDHTPRYDFTASIPLDPAPSSLVDSVARHTGQSARVIRLRWTSDDEAAAAD
jgi:site-specific DNA recombinase